MNNHLRSYYNFKGSWFDIFDKLVGIIKPKNSNNFTIWESKKRSNEHLLIVYGTALTPEWKNKHKLYEITEPEFLMMFKPNIQDHRIHGYNEFEHKNNRRFSLARLFQIL